MTKNKKSRETLKYSDLLKAPFKYRTLQEKFSYKKSIIYIVILMIVLSIISILKNNIENYSVTSDLGVFIYSTIGVTLLFLIPFTIFYIFINSYEKQTKPYLKGLLTSAITVLPLLVLGNFIDYIAQLLLIPSLTMISIFLIFLTMIYSLIAFIFNIKNLYDTTYSRTLSSTILTFLSFTFIFMSGYIMQLISLMR